MDPPLPADPNSPVDQDKKSGRGSVHATIDSALLPPVLPGGKRPSTFDELRFAATMDSGNVSPEDTERVAKLWQGSYSPSSTPRTSLKGKEGVRSAATRSWSSRIARSAKPSAITQKGADYELLNVIGEGGMGVVYAARQASIDRTVAVKMLKPDIAEQAEQRDKFLSEAVVTGDLDHPNIVPIYDLGSNEAGALFYSMKRVQGTPWMKVDRREIARREPRDSDESGRRRGLRPRPRRDPSRPEARERDARRLRRSAGDGLGPGAVHRRCSARPTASRSRQHGRHAGLHGPGNGHRARRAHRPARDVYLLGAILYEIITGKPPHTGKNVMKCLFAAAQNEIQPTEQSGELIEIALRAMSTKPADRPATVQDFQNGIREYQSHSESIVLSTRAEEDLAQGREIGRLSALLPRAVRLSRGLSLCGTATQKRRTAFRSPSWPTPSRR